MMMHRSMDDRRRKLPSSVMVLETGDPNAIGKTIQVDGKPLTMVGVSLFR